MKISIITVTYNNKEGLIKTIQSVVSQTYADKEFVVVDGDSTDGSKELLYDNFSADIDILISEKDHGIYDAINKGIRVCTGEWVICMNAGDVFANENVLQLVFNNPIPSSVSFLYSNYIRQRVDGTMYVENVDRGKGVVFHQAAIYRKKLHELYGYYLVTHPYIVSDLLFFFSVPEELYCKLSFEICISEAAGVSQGLWCAKQALALRSVFGIHSLDRAYWTFVKIRLASWLRRFFT